MSQPPKDTKLCIICGAACRGNFTHSNVCSTRCREERDVKKGEPSVPCRLCGEPTPVVYGITTDLECAGCRQALTNRNIEEDEDPSV